ncbi:hypothetical protein CALCODRAFT_508247 [Calocera cornea HHB12733]|uniref:Uncharacterized protein n=1 Tax=Calocera cornea HHB12733 TaxID=1353952 RepID=A0A165GLG7_9BASI|nr:hypothetical protein CALCODRAFT_508247 [Calocera cornea HHB12733]
MHAPSLRALFPGRSCAAQYNNRLLWTLSAYTPHNAASDNKLPVPSISVFLGTSARRHSTGRHGTGFQPTLLYRLRAVKFLGFRNRLSDERKWEDRRLELGLEKAAARATLAPTPPCWHSRATGKLDRGGAINGLAVQQVSMSTDGWPAWARFQTTQGRVQTRCRRSVDGSITLTSVTFADARVSQASLADDWDKGAGVGAGTYKLKRASASAGQPTSSAPPARKGRGGGGYCR